MSTALVITSIAAPNAVLRAFAEGCRERQIAFILIGDRPSPSDFSLEGCDFWGLDRQREMPFALAAPLPERHYARKNLGYLEAMRQGATVILESDDDNLPYPAFWEGRTRHLEAGRFTHAEWVNLYKCFTDHPIWPRGFALEHLHDPMPQAGAATLSHCPIQQGLADDNPDVDAIYRLTCELPLRFDPQAPPVTLGPGSWCPFNSQNTTWFREAFPLLYLPAYCSFRMTDIWRSFVAQRIAWANDWHVLFHAATVTQERNEHDLMRDFADEVIGYRNNRALCARLAELDIRAGEQHLGDNLLACYRVLVDMELVGREEMPLLDAWIQDVDRWLPPAAAL